MFGVGFFPYPSVFDKTFSTHYFNGGKQEKMKKRLLSMLMAVLMIASLVPATALADQAPAVDDTKTVIDIKVDAAAKQPGITAKVDKATGAVSDYKLTPFVAKIKDQCKVCTDVQKWEQAPTCTEAGLTVFYCGTCGKELKLGHEGAAALGHTYTVADFTVVVAPTCTDSGWGYAICDVCGTPVYADATNAARLLTKGEMKDDAYAKAQKEVAALFEATGHADGVVVAQDGKDAKGVAVKAAKAATHVETVTIDGNTIVLCVALDKDGNPTTTFVSNANDAAIKAGTAVRQNGTGYTGDKVCPTCGVLTKEGNSTDKEVLCLNDTHVMKLDTAGKLPTLDDDKDKVDGVTDKYYCYTCKAYVGGVEIPYDSFYSVTEEKADPALGTTEIRDAKAATCCKEGYTGNTWTYVFKETVKDNDGKDVVKGEWKLTAFGEKIDKLDHHYVAVESIAATCTEPGTNYYGVYKCDNVVKTENGKDILCSDINKTVGEGYKLDKINSGVEGLPVAALGHSVVEKVLVEATCQHTGLSALYCTVCNKYVADEEGNNAYVTAKVNHVAADELANVVEATCTEAGYSGDQVCKWCGETLKKGEEVPALGHKTEVKDAKDATCTEAGYTGDEVCTVCGETVKQGTEIPALGHKFENGVCTVCGAADPDYVVPNPFKDVEKTSPYYDAIIWAANEGVTQGKTADTFGIDEGCTRAQIVTFLYRAAGSPEVAADVVNPFTDVSKDSVYYNAIMWAVEKGITKGTTETTFDPNAVCTRGQIVTFLFRASGDEKVTTGTNFADVAAGSYCADAVAWAVANEITNGFADGTFRPEATCTRGQAVTFIYRALAE